MEQSPFRQTIGRPLVMLLAVLGVMAVILFGLWMVFLAIPGPAALVVAVAVAGYILFLSATFGQDRRISGRALGTALAGSLVAVALAGVVAFLAGPRDLEEEPAADEPPEEEPDTEDDDAIPDDALVFVADDNFWESAPETAEAGENVIAIDNIGNVEHNVVIDELDVRVEADGGEIDFEEYEIPPGEYYFYCDIPGHEATMNGEIVFE